MRFSIVTPSFNQGEYLEQAMESVLAQRSAVDLEYIVIDGGSSDHSVSIIESLGDHLSYWASEPDAGQYDAINKGFSRSTGEVMAWLNSDDMYTPWAFQVVDNILTKFPEVAWITTTVPLTWNEAGIAVRAGHFDSFTRSGFLRGDHMPVGHTWGPIQQESTFWRRSLWEAVGGFVDASLEYAADFELWARFFEHAPLHAVSTPLGGFRIHGKQKTAHAMHEYMQEAGFVLRNKGGRQRTTVEWLLRLAWQRLPRRARARLPLFELGPVVQHDRVSGWELTHR